MTTDSHFPDPHILYRTTHEPTGRYYIGLHRLKNPDTLDPGYLGSGAGLDELRETASGIEFRREVLAVVPDREAAGECEEALVGDEQMADPLCLNRRKGGEGVGRGQVCGTTRERMSAASAKKAADPAFRARQKAGCARRLADPEWRAHVAERNRRLAADPEWQEKSAAGARARSLDPKWRERNRAATDRGRADPEFQKRHREACLKRSADPAWKAKNAAALERMRADPKFQEKKRAGAARTRQPVEVGGVRYEGGSIAAKALGVSPPTITRWLKTGRNGARYLPKEPSP